MWLPSRKITLSTIVLFALCLGAVFFWSYREDKRKFLGPPEKLTLGVYRITVSGLILIAEDQGFFARTGLDVINKHYEYGVLAIRDLLMGKIDIAAATDSVVAWHILRGEDLRILAVVNAANLVKLVARTDRAIRQWSDLKGKKVGLTMGTVAEFFLDRALTFNSLSREDIELVDLAPPGIVEAIKEGSVDAIVAWSPLDDRAEKELGGNVVSWSVQYGQDYYWLLICKSELIRERPYVIGRLLAALALAEKLVVSDQAEAQRIIARQANRELSFIEKTWPDHDLKVSLDQQLVVAMEDAARWSILKGLISKGKPPNFLNFIYFDGLRAVKPEAISIIH